ncbi:Golgi-associated RAB2 interactor protein 2 isoform X2 [Podarcis raffonei]|uniref:Golgi-associated RAB2 interactor protein 2 isoform X2 n=1 Tax=Podarcis raffonei TaxID=65483 RepID=UPI00232987F6|nr:Golgi-associated RAB2 interactor protein 2 isoform X2 [Podarcis raffonei]
MGDLKKILERGEYIPLRSAPVFESNFVQVNRRGESIYLHNRPNYVTMGICASSSSQSLPNVMVLAHAASSSSQEAISARPASRRQSNSEDELVLTRFLPLKFVDVTVHNAKKRRIKLKLVSGRAYYLELCEPLQKQPQLFRQWVRLISLLKSKYKTSSVNTLYKDFKTQEENRATTSKALQGYNQAETPTKPQTSEEPIIKPEIIKKMPSKRVTISDIVGPIEEFPKSHSQATVSSDSCMKNPSAANSEKLKYSQELMKRTISRSKSRGQDFFSITGKRLQTAATLEQVSERDPKECQ